MQTGLRRRKKRWRPGVRAGGGGSFGRIAAGTWDGLLRELVPGCRGDFRAVTPRCQQASCCVCGVRAGDERESWCGGLQRQAAAGPGMFPDGGSPGLYGWGGLREKSAKGPAGAVGSVGSPEQPEQSARLCPPPPPGSGRMPGTGTCRGCGNRAASEPMTCVVCRGSGRAGVGVDGVCCVGVGGGVSCRYCGVSDGFDGCGGLQKGLCRRNGDSFRLVHRTDSVPAVRAQKKGTAYTCRYRGPSG